MTRMGLTARWVVALSMSLAVACSGRSCESSVPADSTMAGTRENGAPAVAVDGDLTDSVAKWQPTPEDLAAMYRAVEAAEKEIPRDTFDPQAIVQKVGNDPVKLFEWVRDNTYWVPYRGALRGPVGVLMDRLGNSLDRSLLLAELLRRAGYTVQLAHAVLPEQRARDLLTRVQHVPAEPVPPAIRSPEQAEQDIEHFAQLFQLDPAHLRINTELEAQHRAQLVREMSERANLQVPFLTAKVGVPAMAEDAAGKAATAMADHWWVKRQDGTLWIDLDPLLSSVDPGAAQAQAESTFAFDKPSGEIPLASEYVQEIRVRVIVEQWVAGQLTEKTALTHTFRPAEAFGQPILFQNLPLAWPKDAGFLHGSDPVGALKAAALKQTAWLPDLTIGDHNIRQSSFTDTGELRDSPGQGAGLGVGAGANGSLGGFDAFGGGDEPEVLASAGYLTAEWIEYEIRVPGEPSRTVRRDVFDLLGREARTKQPVPDLSRDEQARARRALNVLGSVQILPVSCRLSRPYVLKQMLGEVVRNREAIIAMAAETAAGNFAGAVEQAGRIGPSNERLYRLGLARFEWSPVRPNAYIAAPNILSFRNTVTEDGMTVRSVLQGYDIVSNDVAVVAVPDMSPFEIRLAQGVADTNAEDLLLGGRSIGNVGAILTTSGSRDQAWITMRRIEDSAAAGVDWPQDVKNRIDEALGAGYVVVAPRAVPAAGDSAAWAWFRVDPKTGQTLGIGRLGWGQAATEDNVMTLVVLGGVYVHVFGFYCVGTIPRNAALTFGRVLGGCLHYMQVGPLAVAVEIWANQ